MWICNLILFKGIICLKASLLLQSWDNCFVFLTDLGESYIAPSLTVATQQISLLTTTCKYVNWTTHAMVFNLHMCKLCKEAWLLIKFAHPDWWIICKELCWVVNSLWQGIYNGLHFLFSNWLGYVMRKSISNYLSLTMEYTGLLALFPLHCCLYCLFSLCPADIKALSSGTSC